MRARRPKKLPVLAFFIWGLNLSIVLVILGTVGFFTLQSTSTQAALIGPPISATPSPVPSPTGIPTRYALPTVTPNPKSTQIVVVSPTPFIIYGIAPGVIGYSVSGRPIELYAFGHGQKERMIVAGIHGGYEWNTIALADQLLTYINENPQVIPEDVSLYILRNLNPDGDARDHGIDGRVNDHGVDLNRNFPVNWSATWDREGCYDRTPTTSGTEPGSEPETRILMTFLSLHHIDALISYHSAALGIFPGGTPWDEDSIRLAQAIDDVSTYPFPPVENGCIYTGTLADYAVSRGAAAVDLELSDHESTDFTMNLKILNTLLNFEK